MGVKIIQIGSHKGYDDLTNIIKSYKKSDLEEIILVEPQKEFNVDLMGCYKDYDIKIENIVISDNANQKKIKFYSCEEDKNKEISSLNKEHLMKHNQHSFKEQEMECTTINNLLEKYSIFNLDILFIDAEGYDSNIIKSIDYDRFNIKKIYYENLHIDNYDITSFLSNKGYYINKNVLTNGWTNEAIKIS